MPAFDRVANRVEPKDVEAKRGQVSLYPANTGVCTTVGRKPNLGVKTVGASIPRVAVGRIGGIPLSMLSGPAAAGVALTLAPDNVEPT